MTIENINELNKKIDSAVSNFLQMKKTELLSEILKEVIENKK